MQAGVARERDDCMQMVRHEEQEAAVPNRFFVIMPGGVQNGIAVAGAAKVIVIARLAINGDEKRAASATHWGTMCGRFVRTGRCMEEA